MKHLNDGNCQRCRAILEDACPELRDFAKALQEKQRDAHVSCSYRNEADQNHAYLRGHSKAKFGQSPHNYRPSLAIDFFRLTQAGGAAFDRPWFVTVIGPAARAAGLSWGGDWRSFKDYPHVEVSDWKGRVKSGNQAS